MSLSEQIREVARDVEPQSTPGAQPQTSELRAVPQEAMQFPRRPSDELNTAAFGPQADGLRVVVEPLPVTVEVGGASAHASEVVTVREPFIAAVERLSEKLRDHVTANGARFMVEEVPARSLDEGVLARIWNSTRLAQWIRETFPSHVFDISSPEQNGATQKLCQVTISQGFFTSAVTVKVTSYDNQIAAARSIESVLTSISRPQESTTTLNQQQGASRDLPSSPITIVPPAAKELLSKLEMEVQKQREVAEAAEVTRAIEAAEARRADKATEAKRSHGARRLGLGPNASQDEIRAMELLAAQINRDVTHFINGEDALKAPTKRSDGSFVVMERSYTMHSRDRSMGIADLGRGWNHGEAPRNALVAVAMGAGGLAYFAQLVLMKDGMIDRIPFFVAPMCFALFVLTDAWDLLCKGVVNLGLKVNMMRSNAFLQRATKSIELGSLGASLAAIEAAGLRGKLVVESADTASMKVKLTVTYKPEKGR